MTERNPTAHKKEAVGFNQKKPTMKILALIDYVARTGFATVGHNIVARLKKQFAENLQLDIIAINYFGEPYWEDKNTYVVSGRSNDVSDDAFARFFFLKMLKEGEYDGVFICQDLGVIVPTIDVIKHIKQEKAEANKKQFKSVFYFPVDCRIPKELTVGLEFFDTLVTYTNYGKQEVLRCRPDLLTKLKVIPHGTDTKNFFQLPQQEYMQFREEYFPEAVGRYIVTNVSRNQPRKDIPSTIFGFIEAYSVNPDLFLYLHMHPKDPLGWDIRAIMSQTDLVEGEDYKLLPKEYEHEMVTTEMLNNIYNATDCIISTTLGEGWGLTYTEAAITGTPLIVPYSTSFKEMSCGGLNAIMLTTLYPFCGINDNIIREQVDIYEVGDKILECYGMQNGDMVERNYKWAVSNDWDIVCQRWIEIFKKF